MNWVQTILSRLSAARAGYLDVLDSVLVLTETGGTLTSTGGVDSVYLNNAPGAAFEPRSLMIDCTAMIAGDTITIRVYYRIAAAGGLVKADEYIIDGAQDPDLKIITLLPNRYGVSVTLEQTSGSPNDFPWSVCYEVA